MKIPTIVLIITAIVLAGCGKQEQPDTSVADSSPEVSVPEVVEPAETTASDIKEELVTQIESAVESVAESAVETVTATAVEAVKESAAEGITAAGLESFAASGEVLEDETSVPSVTAPSVEPVKESAIESVKATALSAVASVDWANLSWSDVSKVPYNDKDKLVAWAAPQIDVLKDKLAKAAIEKGKLSLSSLGDTGWQGAIKNTASALESVRTSSPETWAMATGALTTAWEALQAEAGKYLGAE